MAKVISTEDRQPGGSRDPERPKMLGSGFVTSVLGEGGAAIVYEIWNPKLEIHRAVKLWRPNVSEKDLQRFETEIKITSKLDHPNIVEIHSVGEWNGLPYIEMERIDGQSLQQILRTNGSLPPVVAVAIMIFICRALFYAHQEEFSLYGRKRKGVIHCDLKPANIMITRNGIVKLMDFGIANPTNVSLHTAADRVTGSLQYMAPEQIRSKQIDGRTDIYSVGVVLYEMLSGTKAFPSKQLLDVIEKRKMNDYVPLNQFCINLPKRFYRMVSTCMQLQPEERYQNVQEVLKELTTGFRTLSHDDPQAVIQQFFEVGSVPTHKIQISRHILIPALAAVVPTTLLIITLMFVMFKPGKPGVSGQSETTSRPAAQAQPVVQQTVTPAQEKADQESPVPEQTAAVQEPEAAAAPQIEAPQQEKQAAIQRPSQPLPSPQPQVRRVRSASTPETDRLSYLESLVESGDLASAIRLFAAQPIEDGAYYSLYARSLYESGEWEQAYEMAETAVKTPSKRISVQQRKGQLLLYKAKYFSYLFDTEPTKTNARPAITAWWEVREFFDGTPKATFAESEINRLSAYIGEATGTSSY